MNGYSRRRAGLDSGPVDPWLPGDIRIERENFRFYFPLVTCLLVRPGIGATAGQVPCLLVLCDTRVGRKGAEI